MQQVVGGSIYFILEFQSRALHDATFAYARFRVFSALELFVHFIFSIDGDVSGCILNIFLDVV